MRFYSMSYPDVLALPLRTFWALFEQVSRLQASEDLRQLDVMTAQHTSEGIEALRKKLVEERGTPVKTSQNATVKEDEFDADGWAYLKATQHLTVGSR